MSIVISAGSLSNCEIQNKYLFEPSDTDTSNPIQNSIPMFSNTNDSLYLIGFSVSRSRTTSIWK